MEGEKNAGEIAVDVLELGSGFLDYEEGSAELYSFRRNEKRKKMRIEFGKRAMKMEI